MKYDGTRLHVGTMAGTYYVLDADSGGVTLLYRPLFLHADILPGEQVHVLNLSNGARLVTYTIEAEAGSGIVLLNGPAARLGLAGDMVVILTYAPMNDDEARTHKAKVVKVDRHNHLRRGH